uniref:ATP synthase complex subunit 8 n=1 Tax=Parapolybia nodosa TaxID=2592910 RepID=A0A514CQP5_9HYME|nr:ATP synthase F0 subunit 8 [Parapolybia nodosa]
MPQLSPLKWYALYLITLIIIFILMIKINFFFYNDTPKLKETKKMFNSLKWKF